MNSKCRILASATAFTVSGSAFSYCLANPTDTLGSTFLSVASALGVLTSCCGIMSGLFEYCCPSPFHGGSGHIVYMPPLAAAAGAAVAAAVAPPPPVIFSSVSVPIDLSDSSDSDDYGLPRPTTELVVRDSTSSTVSAQLR